MSFNNTLSDYKSGIIDCIVLLENRAFSSEALDDFIEGIKSLEKPENCDKECQWLLDLAIEFAENGEIYTETWLSSEIIEDCDSQDYLINTSDGVIQLIESVVFQGEISQKEEENFELYSYCSSVVNQFNYLKNKTLNKRNIEYTYSVLEGNLFFEFSKYLVTEYEWVKGLCVYFFENGSVKINYSDVPEGFISFDTSNLSMQSFDDIILFLRSLRISGDEETIGQQMDSMDEYDFDDEE